MDKIILGLTRYSANRHSQDFVNYMTKLSKAKYKEIIVEYAGLQNALLVEQAKLSNKNRKLQVRLSLVLPLMMNYLNSHKARKKTVCQFATNWGMILLK